jgi:hypothetical protein
MSSALKFMNYVAGKSSCQGAQTTIHCVLTGNDVNGRYYSDCREESGWGVSADIRNDANNGEVGRMFYVKTKEYLKL